MALRTKRLGVHFCQSRGACQLPAVWIKVEQPHECCNGAIVPMTGGTYGHDTIIVNLLVALKLALRGNVYDSVEFVGSG